MNGNEDSSIGSSGVETPGAVVLVSSSGAFFMMVQQQHDNVPIAEQELEGKKTTKKH